MTPGAFAYANARVRALRSGLLDREAAAMLRAAGDAAAGLRTLVDLGVLGSDDQPVRPTLYRRLVALYGTVLQIYPDFRGPVLALLRLHELENLKLAWRAKVLAIPGAAWTPYWRPLEPLGELSREACEEARSPRDLVLAARRTAVGRLVETTFRAHEDDPAAAELAFDRWGSATLLDAAGRLPRREAVATELLTAVVRERDLELLSRGTAAYGLDPEIVAPATALLARTLPHDRLAALAAWSPARGPLGHELPRPLHPTPGGAGEAIADWPALRMAWRRWRRRRCIRAFREGPFRLAPAIGLVLLKEEELRALLSLVESRAGGHDESTAATLEARLAASALA